MQHEQKEIHALKNHSKTEKNHKQKTYLQQQKNMRKNFLKNYSQYL